MIATVFAGSPVGLALAVGAWSLTAFAGYRIWRARHPGDSAGAAIRVRVRWVLGLTVTVVAVTIVRAFPEITVLIIGGYLVVIVALVVLLAPAERAGAQQPGSAGVDSDGEPRSSSS